MPFRELEGQASLPLFRDQGEFPPLILAALFLLVLFFIFDGGQFYIAATRVRDHMLAEKRKRHEAQGDLEGEYEVPEGLDQPVFRLFQGKLAALGVSFALIGSQVLRAWWTG